MIRSRLYVQIYLTVLCSIALIAVVLASFAYMGRFDDDGPLSERINHFSTAMMEGLDPAARQDMLNRLAKGMEADIAIFDPQGHFLLGAGPGLGDLRAGAHKVHGKTFVSTLESGNQVVASFNRSFHPSRRSMILVILIIALVTGVAAYPAVRYLTRRLEELRTGVEAWGNGALSTRVAEGGCDEIALVAQTFNQAADRVEALINSQKSLLANASHELRSPLARLRMATEMYELTQSEALKSEIITNLAELDELVDEILLKSRLESSQPLDTTQLVDLLALAGEEAAQVDAEAEGQHLTVHGNEKLLRRMIRNLVQNAARHGRPPITVEVASESGMASVAVCDNGDGLQMKEAARIFEPFYRPEGRSETAGGWGLGLALVAEIARLHGGRAYYKPLEQGGACFTVELPLATKA